MAMASTDASERNPSNAVSRGQRVLAQEIQGLQALMGALDHVFADVVARMAAVGEAQGRVIVTGMGKSGHVARKIAATLASTGTPAHFVHPGEASHGDLGMITRQDCVLALSNSGETQELGDIVQHCKRFGIPLIAMVRRGGSMLADAADAALVLPDVAEASPVAAPTTSTTMMMALGDALAVALLEARGFTREHFATLHPGGSLGKALLRVSDLMHAGSAIPLVSEQARMPDVLLEITGKHFGCAGVLDAKGALIGIITDGDLRRHMEHDLLTQSAHSVMTARPLTIRPQALAAEGLGVMNSKNITSLFVVDDSEKPVGILHIHDCLRAGIA